MLTSKRVTHHCSWIRPRGHSRRWLRWCRVLGGHGRVVVTDTHARQVMGNRIHVLAEINPQPAIWRQKGARAALEYSTWTDERRCVPAREHPNR